MNEAGGSSLRHRAVGAMKVKYACILPGLRECAVALVAEWPLPQYQCFMSSPLYVSNPRKLQAIVGLRL